MSQEHTWPSSTPRPMDPWCEFGFKSVMSNIGSIFTREQPDLQGPDSSPLTKSSYQYSPFTAE